jgi:hypothetical protein
MMDRTNAVLDRQHGISSASTWIADNQQVLARHHFYVQVKDCVSRI